MDDDLHPDDVRALLRSVENDATTSPNRRRIRDLVLAAYDDGTSDPAAFEPVQPVPDSAPVMALDAATRRPLSSIRAVGLAGVAAAIILAGVLVVRGPSQLDTTGPARPETTGDRRLTTADSDRPSILMPGQQTTDVIGDGLSFDAPDGLIVVTEAEGLIILSVDGASESSGQLVIVETAPSDWRAELADLAETGELSLKEVGATVGGEPTTRFDVTITNSAIEARSCVIGEPCLRLAAWPETGPASLWAGADNRVVELGRSEDSVVLAIEISQQFTGPLSRLAAQVVNSARVDLD